MPRPLRHDPPGGRHHLMNRGARHRPVFRSDDDCAEFMALIDRTAERFGVEVHAFALMPNHFHLLVVSNGERLSDFMSQVQGGYARHLNQQPGWDGPVWRGRFKSVLVTDDAYWEYLVAYVHLNPVRAGLVDGPRFAMWTSLDTYIHKGRPLRCLRTDQVLDAFGGIDGMMAYMDDIQRKRRQLPESYQVDDLWTVPPSQPTPTTPPPRLVRRSAQQALAEVCDVTGVQRDALFVYRRGASNRPAWIAAWWLQEAAGLTQRQVGEIMGLAQTGVAQRGRHLRRHVEVDAELAEWMTRLRGLPVSGRGEENA